ncbi:hypothetical protein MLD38_003152 [Melastoma candidum]|uniref:Uncharacterized protein n=1 Tax=Melastoma candidum TaxID=119954 RepID=A0ACB9S3M7_9MYRT|nr:hypothetical protein MLD38_003152 [Melastoma candidum]
MARECRKSETPHFFKVILRDDGDLCMPKKFVRAHGGALADAVVLEVPGGDTWDVRLSKEDGKFLLRDGWADFLKHYGVRHGHFVIFRYNGGSKFCVAICDVTACEIDYLAKPDARPRPGKTSVQEERVGPELPPCVEEEKKTLPVRSCRPANIPRSSGIHKGTFGSHTVNNCSKHDYPALEAASKSGALSRASSFRCIRPSALIVIQPTYVYPKYCFYMSNTFVRTFIPKAKKCGNIRLYTTGGKSWTVGYTIKTQYHSIQRGWSRFAVDNDLRVGDVCVFESSGVSQLSFRVEIFHSFPEGGTGPCTTSYPKRSAGSGHQTGLLTRNSFRAVIQPSGLTRLNIPSSFIKEHMEPKEPQARRVAFDATLKVAKKSWLVEILNVGPTYNRYRMSKGWPVFAEENGLRKGDICVFSLVEANWVFQVSITRVIQD